MGLEDPVVDATGLPPSEGGAISPAASSPAFHTNAWPSLGTAGAAVLEIFDVLFCSRIVPPRGEVRPDDVICLSTAEGGFGDSISDPLVHFFVRL